MITFIIWNKLDDTAFRSRYFEITGEAVQDYPQEGMTQYMIGSSRITQEQLETLQGEFLINTDETLFIPIS